jgi:hypothetical protein
MTGPSGVFAGPKQTAGDVRPQQRRSETARSQPLVTAPAEALAEGDLLASETPGPQLERDVSHSMVDDEFLDSPDVAIGDTDLFAVACTHLAQKDRVAGTSSHRLVVAAVVASSLLLPGIAHLRLGAVLSGFAFLLVTAVLSAIQFAAPIIEPTAQAALLSSIAFALGWLVSLVAARSAARLLHTGGKPRANRLLATHISHEINRRMAAR